MSKFMQQHQFYNPKQEQTAPAKQDKRLPEILIHTAFSCLCTPYPTLLPAAASSQRERDIKHLVFELQNISL